MLNLRVDNNRKVKRVKNGPHCLNGPKVNLINVMGMSKGLSRTHVRKFHRFGKTRRTSARVHFGSKILEDKEFLEVEDIMKA